MDKRSYLEWINYLITSHVISKDDELDIHVITQEIALSTCICHLSNQKLLVVAYNDLHPLLEGVSLKEDILHIRNYIRKLLSGRKITECVLCNMLRKLSKKERHVVFYLKKHMSPLEISSKTGCKVKSTYRTIEGIALKLHFVRRKDFYEWLLMLSENDLKHQ